MKLRKITMNKPKIGKLFKNVSSMVSKKSPELLIAAGIIGYVSTVVMAVAATPKAMKDIEKVKEEKEVEELTKTETVKATWKRYVPAAVTGVVSTACIVGSSRITNKRMYALSSAYIISEKALAEYKEQVLNVLDKKDIEKVNDAVAKKKVTKNPPPSSNVVIAGDGTVLCYDQFSGYHMSDIHRLRSAIVSLNEEMFNSMHMYVSLNEFYDELDWPRTKLGDQLGWHIDDGQIKAEFTSTIADDGRPAIVIDFNKAPKYDFNKVYR